MNKSSVESVSVFVSRVPGSRCLLPTPACWESTSGEKPRPALGLFVGALSLSRSRSLSRSLALSLSLSSHKEPLEVREPMFLLKPHSVGTHNVFDEVQTSHGSVQPLM